MGKLAFLTIVATCCILVAQITPVKTTGYSYSAHYNVRYSDAINDSVQKAKTEAIELINKINEKKQTNRHGKAK
jgi:hypothetical protein